MASKVISSKLQRIREFLTGIAGTYTPEMKVSGKVAQKAAWMQQGAEARASTHSKIARRKLRLRGSGAGGVLTVAGYRHVGRAMGGVAGRPPRDYWEVTPELQEYVNRAFAEWLRARFAAGQIPTPARALDIAAAAFKTAVLERLQLEGAFGFTPAHISSTYAKWKLRHGFSPFLGFKTGVMYRGMSSAKWVLRKVG